MIYQQQMPPPDDGVMSFADWCEFNNISEPTGRRLIKSGDGPEVTRLSPRRIGITYGADRRWKAGRVQRCA